MQTGIIIVSKVVWAFCIRKRRRRRTSENVTKRAGNKINKNTLVVKRFFQLPIIHEIYIITCIVKIIYRLATCKEFYLDI